MCPTLPGFLRRLSTFILEGPIAREQQIALNPSHEGPSVPSTDKALFGVKVRLDPSQPHHCSQTVYFVGLHKHWRQTVLHKQPVRAPS